MRKFLLASFALALSYSANSQTVTDTFLYTGAVQTFTVPPCVTSVNIHARGAQGGAVTGQSPFPQGGLGASMIGDFTVNPGDVLTVIVGGRGNPDPSSSGGGGGSGVNNGNTILIVAGGGAGVDFQDPSYPGQHAVVTQNGVAGNGSGGAGGTGGSAGGDWIYNGNNFSRGGNGWLAGQNGSTGVNGSSSNTTYTNGTWGLGGGGGSVGYGWCNCGGGGGGYSGGGSGNINVTGGGGGSYNIGTNQINTGGVNTGAGKVLITYTIGASAPASPASISGNNQACANGDTVVFSISSVPTATGYTWSVPAGSTIVSGQGTTAIAVLPGTTSGTVSVTADNACGSSAPTTMTFTINANPVISLGGDTTQCGGTVTLDAQIAGATYLWSDNSTAQTLMVNASGNYSVMVTDANGCSGTDTVMVTINTVPTVSAGTIPMLCVADGLYMLSGAPAGGTWTGSFVSGMTFDPNAAGQGSYLLTYTYTDSLTGCMNMDTTTATVDLCLAVSENTIGFTVSPNPNNGSFVIDFGATRNAGIELVDVTGRAVQTVAVNASRTTINCESQPAGVYFVRVTADGKTSMQKITVVR